MATSPRRSSIPSKPKIRDAKVLVPNAPIHQAASVQPDTRPRIPTNVPSIYADLITDVVYGIHTTKLVFGIENGSAIQAVGVAVLPTAALLASVLAIKENLTEPAMVEEMTSRLSGVLRLMRQELNPKRADATGKTKG